MQTDKNPLISAIITTKDRPAMLRRALQSVLAQTYMPVEIIVVDDGSTDDIESVIKLFKRDIIYLKNEQSVGAPAARNQGIKAAAGTFVAGLDDDDEWHPERLEQMMAVYDDSFACVTSNVKMQYKKRAVVWHKKAEISLYDLLYSNQVGNQVLVKRERLLAVGGFDEQLKAAQDYDLWIRLCERYGPIINVKKPLQIIHTEHENERISNPNAQLHGYFDFYKKHKSKMNRRQRKYQLYNVRRAQGKHQKVIDILGWVPPNRYFKESKRWIIDRFF